jgi:signal transduction histidine kinase
MQITDQKLDLQTSQLQAERAKALARMASDLSAETSLEHIFQIACVEITGILRVQIAFIAIYDEKSDTFQLVKIIKPDDPRLSIPDGLFSQSMFKKMKLTAGRPMFVPDIRTLKNTHELIIKENNNIRTLLATGLFRERRKIGLIGVLTWDKKRIFSEDEITLLQTFADNIAVAIDHASLLLATQRQSQRLMLINEITQEALNGSDLKKIMDLLAIKVVETLAAAGCYITRWDNELLLPVPYAAYGKQSVSFMNASSDSGEVTLSQTVLLSGHAVFLEEIHESSLVSEPQATPAGHDVLLALPLKVGEQNMGAILIKHSTPHPYFVKEDISIWEKVASQISLTIASILSFEKEKQRRKEAELLQQITFSITSSLDLKEVLDHILTGLEQTVPFNGAVITLIEDDYLRIAASRGSSRYLNQVGKKIGKSDGLFSLLESSHSAVILKDAQAHPKYEHRQEKEEKNLHGWMGIPLIAHNHPIGYLELNSQTRDVYTADHARLAQTFANQTAVAIENAKLFEQVRNGRKRLQELSRKWVEFQEAERRLIAHELHDEIGQELTGLQFILLMGKEGAESDRISAFTEAQGIVATLMAQVRDLSIDLHPAMLDDLGLLPTLTNHFNRYQQQTHIQVHFDYENLDRRFPAEIELCAFRVVQETLTNVARYAEIDKVYVFMSADGTSLNVRVEDRGRGFDMDILRDSQRSFGLSGIRERTYLLGGKFEISSKLGEGTRIVAILPIGTKLERRGNDR